MNNTIKQIIPDKILKCSCCGEEKHSTEYNWVAKGDANPFKTLNSTKCKSCQNKNSGLVSKLRRIHKKPEDNLCEVCRKPPKEGKSLVCDHNHDTGEFRGYLCNDCNVGIGYLGDTLQDVKSAFEYLNKTKNIKQNVMIKNEMSLELVKALIENGDHIHATKYFNEYGVRTNFSIEKNDNIKSKSNSKNTNDIPQKEQYRKNYLENCSNELNEITSDYLRILDFFNKKDNGALCRSKSFDIGISNNITLYKTPAQKKNGWIYYIHKNDKNKLIYLQPKSE
jgi:hypothetical protein